MKEQVDDRLAMFRIASVHSTAYRGKTRVIKNRINYLWIYWWSIIINYWILLLLMWYFLNVIKIRFPIFLTLARKIKIPTLKEATLNSTKQYLWSLNFYDPLYSIISSELLSDISFINDYNFSTKTKVITDQASRLHLQRRKCCRYIKIF